VTATRFIDHLPTGDHASRPAASAVPQGTLYSCTTHSLIYQSDGTSAWTTWATLGSPIADILDLPTAEMTATKVLAPDGAGGVEFRAEAGGGSGTTHSFVGYNTVGGSFAGMDNDKYYCKKITLAADAVLLSIGAYIKGNNQGGVVALGVALMDDTGGVPTLLRSAIVQPTDTSTFIDKAAAARWFHVPVGGFLLAAGDYWIGFCQHGQSGSEQTQLAYDGSGSDVTFTSGGNWATEGDQYANTVTSNKYSIRASILS